jgi:hypothetical protein
MRIYVIGNDGITLCLEPPATVNKGEIAVASREELHAARLSGKRLLALWNALPAVEKQTKVGDRNTLIDRLWSAIDSLPDPDQGSDTKRSSKQDAVIAMRLKSAMRWACSAPNFATSPARISASSSVPADRLLQEILGKVDQSQADECRGVVDQRVDSSLGTPASDPSRSKFQAW